jgi:hypothetical protein
MGFFRYDSKEGTFGIICPKCNQENIHKVEAARIDGPKVGEGLVVRCPPCSCGAVTVLFTGSGVGSMGGHAANCFAGNLVKRMLCDNLEAAKERMERIISRYPGDQILLPQVNQEKELKWVSSSLSDCPVKE